jgi:hypothetical protein
MDQGTTQTLAGSLLLIISRLVRVEGTSKGQMSVENIKRTYFLECNTLVNLELLSGLIQRN